MSKDEKKTPCTILVQIESAVIAFNYPHLCVDKIYNTLINHNTLKSIYYMLKYKDNEKKKV